MEWSDTALVLGVGRFRESDLWLRMLTRRHGIVSAFAFGGSRSRKRFCGCLDLFNELQISTKTTRNGMYLSLQEGAPAFADGLESAGYVYELCPVC